MSYYLQLFLFLVRHLHCQQVLKLLSVRSWTSLYLGCNWSTPHLACPWVIDFVFSKNVLFFFSDFLNTTCLLEKCRKSQRRKLKSPWIAWSRDNHYSFLHIYLPSICVCVYFFFTKLGSYYSKYIFSLPLLTISSQPKPPSSFFLKYQKTGDLPGDAVVKNPPANAGDTGSIPGPGRSHMTRSI